jgi:predicted ATP-binding protein involved in virulence
MISVRTLSNDDWAKYALLIIYAWDMCDLNQDPASNDLDPRILADGWMVVGIISGGDNVLATASSARQGTPPQNASLRQSMVRPGADIRRYGYLAVNAAGDTYVAVIRGTDGAEGWIDDVVFIGGQRPQFPGRVEAGFTDIYLSMEYRPLAGGPTIPLADGIRVAVGTADVLVLGHSLGSALAEFLAYQLADENSLGAARVGAIMYASPKVGDHDFVDAFSSRVTNHIVINFEHDVVPQVPPFDITNFDLYRPLPYTYTITDETALASVNPADKACCHYLINYIAMLSPAVFTQSAPSWTSDETQCAKCLLTPATLVDLVRRGLVDPTFRDVERIRSQRAQFEDQLFQRNLKNEFVLKAFHWQGVTIFEDGSYWFAPRINVLLGKNGYGKTILFRVLTAMMQRNGDSSGLLFNGAEKSASSAAAGVQARLSVEVTRNGSQEEIVRDATYFIDEPSPTTVRMGSYTAAGKFPVGKIPLLAIPDSRFVNRTRRTVAGAVSASESLASSGARNFMTQEPYENVVQDFLTQLCIDYLEPISGSRMRGFDRYIFRLVEEVLNELTEDGGFRFAEIRRVGTSGFEILVYTAGSQDIPIPIQSASQGTLSVVAVFGLIYSFLHSLRPDLAEDAVPSVVGTVLIDEIDAHLHPSWQQKILGMLTGRFPNVQFIVCAHSPAIVAGCDQNEVSVLRKRPDTGRFYVETLPEDFLGANSQDLYRRVFEIEDVDRLYLEFTTKSFQAPEDREREIEQLEKSPQRSTQDEVRLEQLLRESRLVDRAEQARDQRLKLVRSQAQFTMLDAELARLKQKAKEQESEIEQLKSLIAATPRKGEEGDAIS